jgi:6-phosphofructokinase 2
MLKIVTVTFSPSIDKSTSVQALVPEKKLKCNAPKLEPGGGGINVARAIKKLGGEVTAVFPSGGYTGEFFNHLLSSENIDSVIIRTANETRENIIVVDEMTGKQYRFGMPGTKLTDVEWKACLDAIEGIDDAAYIVASGSLPPGVPVNIYAEIAKIARKKNAKFIVDTCGEALQHAADEGLYLLKPNLGELSDLSGRNRELGLEEIEIVAREIIQKGKSEVLVISMGAAGAMLVTSSETIRVKAPVVQTKSTVGAGDSMLAGIIFSLANGQSLATAVQFGVACGTAATMNPGTELFKKEDVDYLFHQAEVDIIPVPQIMFTVPHIPIS